MAQQRDRERWRSEAEALWAQGKLSFADAGTLIADIIRKDAGPDLTNAAREALPFLRRAAARGADEFTRALARRRFGRILHELARRPQPVFGRRAGTSGDAPPPAIATGADAEQRRLLGLSPSGPVSGAAVAAAFRERAKTIHPDRGGTADGFAALVAARDALLLR